MLTAHRITGPVTHHGEGPYWDAESNRLLCMDVLAGAIVSVTSSGQLFRYPAPSRVVSLIRRRTAGGFVIATERGIVTVDETFGSFSELATVTADRAVRTNDGGCDALGGLVIGTMAYDECRNAGRVYRLTPEHGVVELLSPVSISNGVQWSADGRRAFYIDTPTQRVDAFDVDPDTGAWSGRRPHLHIDTSAGAPDGMAIDEEGGIWVALWGGGAVAHFDAAGRLVDTIRVPGVSQVSSCTFGESDRKVLYITTSRLGLRPDDEPDAGAVFAVPTNVRGAIPGEFAG